MALRRSLPLDEGWTFRQAKDIESEFRKTQGFPTEIHRDLMHHGLIPNPFRGKHEIDVQWVGEQSWIYKTTFPSPKLSPAEKAVLAFDGLDTYATVELNGTEILKTQDMFIPERVDVTKEFSSSGMNELEITFDSAYLKGKKIVENNPNHHWGCWNGDPSRLAVRKAQYHYSRISDLYFITDVAESLDSADLMTEASVEGEADQVRFELSFGGAVIGAGTVEVECGFAQTCFTTKNPRLWYPRKYGKQPLYSLTGTLFANGQKTDTVSKRFGLRRINVVEDKIDNAKGTSFMFEVNNIPVFCGGSNWIPADSFLTRLTAKKYSDWVRMVADGNQVMLRVWGGGIYEEEAFYDACDEMGVLVWQDFMFACGNYPATTDFLDLVRREAISNIKRLKHHPSIVLWAGNNEDYQYAESEGLEYDRANRKPESWLKSNFPARYIYEKILVDVTSRIIPRTKYHFGSPYGGTSTTDPTVGDIHQWNVWHGTQEKYQDFDKLSGRFVSEFGMQAFPDIKTTRKFSLDSNSDPDMYAASSTISCHNKAIGHDRRLAIYLAENLRYRFEPFDYYIYCTQIMQAECIGRAYMLWKRQWKGPGKEYCAGALVWQTNDCWPCISWSIIDYELRPKLAYYAVKREMEPITIGMKRTMTKIPADRYTGAFVKTVYKIQLWVCNLEVRPHRLGIAISTANLDSGAIGQHPDLFRVPVLLPNRSTEVMEFEIPVCQEDVGEEEQTVVCATLVGPQNKVMKRVLNWPEPLKFVHLPKPQSISCRLGQPLNDDGLRENSENVRLLSIMSKAPLKGVSIGFEGLDNQRAALLSDDGFDLMVGPESSFGTWHSVKVTGLSKGEATRLRIRYLGCEEDYVADVVMVDGKDEDLMSKDAMVDELPGLERVTLY
ncbi:MAG: hypothetical protein Q9217_000150 [Psora testacea]